MQLAWYILHGITIYHGHKIFCDDGNKHSLIISSATLLVAACAIEVLLAKRYGRCGIFDSKTASQVISRDLCV